MVKTLGPFAIFLAAFFGLGCQHVGDDGDGADYKVPGYATLTGDGRFWEVRCPGLDVAVAVSSRADFYANGQQMTLIEFCEQAEDRRRRRR